MEALPISLLALLLTFFLLFLKVLAFLLCFQSFRGFLRMSGIVVLAIVLSLFLVFGPGGRVSVAETETLSFVSILFLGGGELLKGFLLGVPLAVALQALPMAARLADVSRGAQFGEQLSPNLGARLSQLENLAVLAIPLLGFTYGGYQLVVYFLLASTEAPAFTGLLPYVESIARLGANSIALAVFLAAPVMIVLFFLDILAATLTRALGRINVLFEMLPLKLVLGLLIAAWCASETLVAERLVAEALIIQRTLLGLG